MMAVVIEDSRTQAYRLRLLLEREGFSVQVAENGEAGLALCRGAQLPDVVVSDVIMPGIDGYEVCRRLKADPATRDLPIVLLTSLADPPDVVRALAAGANNFVTKPYDDARLVARIRRTITAGARPADECAVDVQGQRVRVDASPARILDLLVSCLEDAAERSAELEANRAQLARVNDERETLMATVAHELKGPLTAMLLRSQMVEEMVMRDRDAELLKSLPGSVEKQVGQMLRIINDLQVGARSESNGYSIEIRQADLAETIRDVVARTRQSVTSHVIMSRVPPELPAHLDTGRIEQIVSNLLANAVKYSAPDSRIEVMVEAQPEGARVTVKDQGIGIPTDALARVFDRHFRTAEGRAKAPGLGLGLYVCKQLVELHGGTIGVESKVGEGSSFWFTLPHNGPPT